MFESWGRRLRGEIVRWQKPTPIEWLVLALAVLVLGISVYSGAVELRRQGRAREMLAQVKAARLATTLVATQQYATGGLFADFTSDDGFAEGIADEIIKLGALPGEVRLLQTDASGYGVQCLAYREGLYLAVYDADGSWLIFEGQKRILTTFEPASSKGGGV